jgi:hypothetical protein
VAVVVAKYIPPNAQANRAAKRNIRYIEHRPGKDGERLWRTLFGNDGRVSREEAYTLIDHAEKGSIFWTIKISPDPKTEDSKRDLSMQEITERVMNSLSEQLNYDVQYVAAIHADHKPHRHIHVLARLPKLSQKEFRELPNILIQSATESAQAQRQELDNIKEHRQNEKERIERDDAQWELQLQR